MRIYQHGVHATIQGLQNVADLRAHRLGWAADAMQQPGVPVVSYPGDEMVEVPYGDAMTYDPKGRGFPQLAMRTVLISAQAAGAQITEQVFEDVRRMAVGPEAADTYLDNCDGDPTERDRRHTVVIDTVRSIVLDNIHETASPLLGEDRLLYGGLRYYGTALHTMPNAARDTIGAHSEGMLRTSLAKSRAQTLPEYAQLARREAEQYAHVWSNTVWARQSAEARKAFPFYDRWIAATLGGMLVAAAGLDLRKDYANGEITFRPRSFTPASASLILRGLSSLPAAAGGYIRLKRS